MAKNPSRLAEASKIVLLGVVASIVYGVIHDQITARLYLPYFNEWSPHADYFRHPNPTIVGLYWGVVATWWVGLILGVILAWASTVGPSDPWTWRRLIQPMFLMLCAVGLSAGACGIIGLAAHWVHPSVAGLAVPDDDIGSANLDMFTAVHSAHIGSYTFGALGGLVLAGFVWQRRVKDARSSVSAVC